MRDASPALIGALVLAFSSSCASRGYTSPQVLPAAPLDSDIARFVDPFIGTAATAVEGAPFGDVGGAVFPGAAVPFGMLQWSPDTAPAAEFSYLYADTHIKGFTVNHLSGPGCAALLDFPFLPTTLVPQRSPALDRGTYAAGFSHADEHASPGFYAVRLASGIEVELTAEARAARARITYPKGAPAGLLIEAAKSVADSSLVTDGKLEADTSNTVVATLSSSSFCGRESSYRVHLAAAFDHDFVETDAYHADTWQPGASSREGAGAGVYLRFDTEHSATVGVVIAISYVSPKNARENLEAALAEASFDKVRANARSAWNRALGRIEVRGGTPQALRTFYTALYHTLLHPNVFSDVNGEYAGFDGQVHTARGYTQYANYSGWDVYRSWIQLLALIAPQEATDIVRSLVVDAQQCGGLPRWTLANSETGVMAGDPGALLIANAWAFGVRGFDAKAALALMQQGASLPGLRCHGYEVRPGLSDYNQLGYLPAETSDALLGPTSTTLEYTVADFAIARFAQDQGDRPSSDRFLARARNWRNLYNPQTGYIQPRLRSGEWMPGFDPSSVHTYLEGNAAQYTFFVPHDVPGLARAMGGNAAMMERLDALFTQLNGGIVRPYYYVGNEPSFGTPWLYDYLGAPWKTQAILPKIVSSAFSDKPDGLPGNDDLGAMSSFLVWAQLGLYPDVPGVGGFALTSPTFPWVAVTLPSGRRLEIVARDAGPDRPYVQSLEIDAEAWDSPWLPFEKIERGARLSFELGAQPEPRWGHTPPPRYFAP